MKLSNDRGHPDKYCLRTAFTWVGFNASETRVRGPGTRVDTAIASDLHAERGRVSAYDVADDRYARNVHTYTCVPNRTSSQLAEIWDRSA